MLDQLAAFLKAVDCELVILKFSHFCSFNDADHERLIARIQDRIGEFLFSEITTGDQMLKKTFADLTSEKPLVLIDYRDDYVSQNPAAGFWRDLPTYNHSSDKNNYQDMQNDQLAKLKENSGNANRMFLLSWTLTPDQDSFMSYSSLHEMSKSANRHLGSFCREWAPRYLINYLYVDFFEDARAVDIAILING